MHRHTGVGLVILVAAGPLTALAMLAPPATVGGTVKSVSPDGKQITLTVGSGKAAKEVEFRVAAGTRITLDDKAAKLGDLAVGTKVTVTYDKTSKEAVSFRATTPKAETPKADTAKSEATEKAPRDAAQNDRAKEREKLAGTWQGFVVNGKGENPNAGPVKLEVIIAGDKMTAKDLQSGNKSMGEGTYKLDLAKKTIDPTGNAGPEIGKSYLGIYSLEGDTLKWCVANPGKARPTQFVTKTGQFLLILKRQKS